MSTASSTLLANGKTEVRGELPILTSRPRSDFVQTPFIQGLTERALTYIAAGYPVHFRGPSGSGKTTLALHVAHRLGRPISFLCGDDEFGSSDLVGGQFGYRKRKVVDNFVHSVLKTEEDVMQHWIDHRLTVACREGFTLVYDEFSRSRPEANNVLLGVLEERLLMLPTSRDGLQYLKVHPSFVSIFTSNPQEYAGVHNTQDALLDRMITIEVSAFDRETEIAITQSKSGVSLEDATRIVDLVGGWRTVALRAGSTVRSCIMIGKILALKEAHARPDDETFEQACIDVLASAGSGAAPRGSKRVPKGANAIRDLIKRHCNER
jgi:nitric oxide reductase NorQ protein